MFNSPWTVIFIMSYFRQPLLCNKWSWPWQDGWSLLRQRGWFGFRWPLASHHFHPLFCLFWSQWRKCINAMFEMTKIVNKDNKLAWFYQMWLLISVFLTEGNKKILIHKEKSHFPFSATAHRDFEILKKAVFLFLNIIFLACIQPPLALRLGAAVHRLNFSKWNGMWLLFKEKRSPFFHETCNAYFIFRELGKDRFIFLKRDLDPPFTTLSLMAHDSN